MTLSAEQLQRYARQLKLPEVGDAGQNQLAMSSVLLIGTGGLGSAAALYLAAAGVGRLGLTDADSVDLSNLQRQILHFTPDLHKPKTQSAREKINSLNPDVRVETYQERLDAGNLPGLLTQYDFIIDATDNFITKFLISDECVRAGKPFSHAGVTGWEGQTFTYLPDGRCGCYRCLFAAPPPPEKIPDQAAAGILGAVAGTLGTLQATEALKYLLGLDGLLTNRLLVYQARRLKWREIRFQPAPDCPVCREKMLKKS